MSYRPFATIRLALERKIGHRNFSIEVSARANKNTTSFNLDDFPEDDSDMYDAHPLAGVKNQLPHDGHLLLYTYSRSNGGFLDDFVVTLKNAQVIEVEGKPWIAPAPAAKPGTKANVLHVEARALVHATAKKLLAALRRSKVYDMDKSVTPAVKISFSLKRRRSYGGEKGISLALGHWVRDGEIIFPEYAAFRGDPEIGRTSGDWQHVVAVLVAHEMAHWVQRSISIAKPVGLNYRLPHGAGFREIYRFLRKHAIKPGSKQ